ncbi:hypothetical protein GGI23_007716 [Coemansia sp. RSA 2559]|nr:hypothetical protein GGI23_007716 [Coemansia sp. RSA 2559]KAJ2857092.1 hypothetical protein GGI22_003609 [Coemansia erecta]
MEAGDDFFARPLPRRSLRKQSNSSSSIKQSQTMHKLDRADDDTPSLPQDNGRRFATTNGGFAGGNSSEGMGRTDGCGGGRRVFTLPSLTRANSNATSFSGNKPYVGCILAPSSSASTACGSD